MADDGKLTAELAAIRQRAEAAADFPLAEIAEFLGPDTKSIGGWIAATALDVPRLLKAVEAALNLTADWQRNWAEGEAPHELARELREAIEREMAGNLEPEPFKRPEGCVCTMFRDTGGFRIADLTCPVHGVAGTDPGDGNWEKTREGNADAEPE